MPRVRRVASKSASKDGVAKSQEPASRRTSATAAAERVTPPDAATGRARPSAADEPDDFKDIEPWLHMNKWEYRFRQYSAIVLCIASVIGVGTCTGSGTEWWSSYAMVGCLLLMVAALILHEFRPYQGPGWDQMAKARETQAKLDQALKQAKEE